jgi:hypothetical protein
VIAEFNRVFGDIWGVGYWQGNLDAFNDMLDWPCDGEPYVLVWSHSEETRHNLSHPAIASWLRDKLSQCQPGFGQHWQQQLTAAEQGQGQTLFEWLLDIIQSHQQIEVRLE